MIIQWNLTVIISGAHKTKEQNVNVFLLIFSNLHHCFNRSFNLMEYIEEYKYDNFQTSLLNLQKPWKIPISSFFSRHFSLRRGFRYLFRQFPTDSSSRATHVYTHTHAYILYSCVYTHPIPALNASATIRIGNCAVCIAAVTSNTSR